MPYVVRKVPNKNCWKVVNDKTGAVHTKCGTQANAMKQKKLLNELDFRHTTTRMKKMK